MNESKTIPKTHELHSIRSVGITNVVQTRKMTCCCLNCVTGAGQCEFFEIAGKWMFQSVIGETLSKSTINKVHRKINNKGAVSEDQIRVNKYRMGKLGKPEKTREKKNSEDEEIDFPSEKISPAMYRQKKMEERKRKLPSDDGSKMSQSCRKKIKFGDELFNSTKKKKKAKQHDIPNDVEEDDVNDVREKLCPHKDVKYMEDCSFQYDDDDDDDGDYYPSSQDSQVSLLEMGIKRIQSVNNVEGRKEKIETSCGVINKKEPKLEERRKEKMETTSTMMNKQTPKEDKIILVPELMEEVMKSDDNSEELEGGIFWKEFQRKMLRCKNFAEIVQIVDSTKIPDISLQRKTTMQPHDRQDQISQYLLPQDVDENLVPVMCKGDGNCF